MANIMLAVAPTGFWENIIFGFNNGIGNYAVAIILLTICIKLVLTPVDFFNRRSSVKMQEVQTKLAPKMAEIKKRYPDPQVQNQKVQELYTKEGFNPMGSCISMLLSLVLNMVVLFTLLGSLNSMASYKITDQYENLRTAYIQEYVMEDRGITEEEFKELELTKDEIGNYVITISQDVTAKSEAGKAVKEKYAEVKESFLWIKNVWIADSPTAKEIPDFNTYASVAGLTFEDKEARNLAEKEYNAVMSNLQAEAGVNGYFILAVLTGVTAFLYQYLLTKQKKKKDNFYTKQAEQNGQQNPMQSSGKAMLIILPIIMVVFTLSYNAIFALYIIASQLVGMATAPLVNWLINKTSNKSDKKSNVIDVQPNKSKK